MYNAAIFDADNTAAADIEALEIWEKNNNVSLLGNIADTEDVYEAIVKYKPNILLFVIINREEEMIPVINKIMNSFFDIKLVVIGGSEDYKIIRKIFISGVFDYILYPDDAAELENILTRVNTDFGLSYIVNRLSLKTDALIDNIFMGGGQQEYIIESIIEQIYVDWIFDPINCQKICNKAKTRIYEVLTERKPWLEKFLYKSDFVADFDFKLKTKKIVEKEWERCFSEASAIVLKYQMIDDELVYRIGKYVVVHVDENLSLEKVAKGIFLNPSYVSHIFKKITGMSFTDFMKEVKVDRAKVLLRDEKIKIYDVAATVGFNNPEYFTKIFKGRTGYSPVEYQQYLKEKYKAEV